MKLKMRLNIQVKQLMGDTRINLNSPEQMSWVIYSRKPKDKLEWANTFSPYMEIDEYKKNVKSKQVLCTRQNHSNALTVKVQVITERLRKMEHLMLDLQSVILVILWATFLYLVKW